MELKTRTFVYNVAVDCRLRHTVVRYDTAHGFAHRDRLHADGTSEKTPLPIEDYRQALSYAEADLKDHWEGYRDHFLEEVKHEER